MGSAPRSRQKILSPLAIRARHITRRMKTPAPSSEPDVKRQDRTPLGFSSHRVNILSDFIVALVSQHRSDHAHHVVSESADRVVVALALGTLAVVVRGGLGDAADVPCHRRHHYCLGATIDLARASCARHLA